MLRNFFSLPFLETKSRIISVPVPDCQLSKVGEGLVTCHYNATCKIPQAEHKNDTILYNFTSFLMSSSIIPSQLKRVKLSDTKHQGVAFNCTFSLASSEVVKYLPVVAPLYGHVQ